jgi:hypothetical protein
MPEEKQMIRLLLGICFVADATQSVIEFSRHGTLQTSRAAKALIWLTLAPELS